MRGNAEGLRATTLPPSSLSMLLLQEACQLCAPRTSDTNNPTTAALFKCARCHAVLYCGRDHQSADFAAHKTTCKRIKKLRETLTTEEANVRNAREDEWTPANAFETHVGRFWSILSTRPYMTAKLELIRALSTIASRPAIETAAEHALDAQRLCHSDNLGIRRVIPTLLLLLGKYQDAYDFIKWWTTDGDDPHYDFADMTLPYLHVRDADMSEEIPACLHEDRAVFFTSAIAYMKLTLADAVERAIDAHGTEDGAAPESDAQLRAFVTPHGQVRGLSELKQLHTTLKRQTNEAFALSHVQNQHFWDAMLDPTPIVKSPKPQTYEPGDANQVKLWVLQCAMLWRDHHAFIREHRHAYPAYMPEMPHPGPKWLITFP